MRICEVCGMPAECRHHLIFGRSLRQLADQDHIYIDLCNKCHNMSQNKIDRIHENSMAEHLSKMLGQVLWERNYIAESQDQIDQAHKAFMERYGRSYIDG